MVVVDIRWRGFFFGVCRVSFCFVLHLDAGTSIISTRRRLIAMHGWCNSFVGRQKHFLGKILVEIRSLVYSAMTRGS
jgi:hypothetical protein